MKNSNSSEDRYSDGEVLHLVLKALLSLPEQKTGNPYYDNSDLKRLFHVSDSTLYRLRRQNAIPYRTFGKRYYYPKSFFDRQFGEDEEHNFRRRKNS